MHELHKWQKQEELSKKQIQKLKKLLEQVKEAASYYSKYKEEQELDKILITPQN